MPDRYSLLYTTHMHKRKVSERKGENGHCLSGRVWIDGPEGTFLGYGRIILLERIREFGSITKAAGSMEMSYRHAWKLVESMNRQAASPLVTAATGGRGGGGASLTEAGDDAISLFWAFYKDFQVFLGKEEKKFGRPSDMIKGKVKSPSGKGKAIKNIYKEDQ